MYAHFGTFIAERSIEQTNFGIKISYHKTADTDFVVL